MNVEVKKMPKEVDYPYTPSPFLPDLEALAGDEETTQARSQQGAAARNKNSERQVKSEDPTYSLKESEANFPE